MSKELPSPDKIPETTDLIMVFLEPENQELSEESQQVLELLGQYPNLLNVYVQRGGVDPGWKPPVLMCHAKELEGMEGAGVLLRQLAFHGSEFANFEKGRFYRPAKPAE